MQSYIKEAESLRKRLQEKITEVCNGVCIRLLCVFTWQYHVRVNCNPFPLLLLARSSDTTWQDQQTDWRATSARVQLPECHTSYYGVSTFTWLCCMEILATIVPKTL